MAVFDPFRLLATFVAHDVEFIVIGQIAAVLQGHPETTVDLDILPRQTVVNAEHLTEALRSIDARHVRHRAGGDDPIPADERDFIGWRAVRSYDTIAGRVDVMPAAAGVGTFDDHQSSTIAVDLDDFTVLVASLDAVIASKEAAGRPKDQQRLPSLHAFRDQIGVGTEDETA